MSRSLMTVRPISDAEAAVVERSLVVAATDETAPALSLSVRGLQVVGRCECGCASVDFCRPAPGQVAHIVADAVAKAPNGEDLGLIIWALNGHLSGLEVYSYSDNPAPLPVVASISGYGSTGNTDAA
jgi:hypothetical protein